MSSRFNLIVDNYFNILSILPLVLNSELKIKGYVDEQSEYLNSGLFGDKFFSP